MKVIIEPYENCLKTSEQALRHDHLVDICTAVPK